MKLFYTYHARERMNLRVISEEEIIEALENGDVREQEEDKYEVEYGRVRIAFNYDFEEKVVTVITVIPSRAFSKEVKKYARKNKVSHRIATKILKGVA